MLHLSVHCLKSCMLMMSAAEGFGWLSSAGSLFWVRGRLEAAPEGRFLAGVTCLSQLTSQGVFQYVQLPWIWNHRFCFMLLRYTSLAANVRQVMCNKGVLPYNSPNSLNVIYCFVNLEFSQERWLMETAFRLQFGSQETLRYRHVMVMKH